MASIDELFQRYHQAKTEFLLLQEARMPESVEAAERRYWDIHQEAFARVQERVSVAVFKELFERGCANQYEEVFATLGAYQRASPVERWKQRMFRACTAKHVACLSLVKRILRATTPAART